jgi:hypothetical protein
MLLDSECYLFHVYTSYSDPPVEVLNSQYLGNRFFTTLKKYFLIGFL